MTPETLLKVCSMPNAFTTSLNKSMVQLLKESGYLGHENEVTKDEIMEFLKTHPDFIESWKEYSEDKRCSSGWYLLHEDSIWTVGYFGVGGKAKEQRYTSGFEACAVFILKELEQLAESAS